MNGLVGQINRTPQSPTVRANILFYCLRNLRSLTAITYTAESPAICVVEYNPSPSTLTKTAGDIQPKIPEKSKSTAKEHNTRNVRSVIAEVPSYSYDDRNQQFRTKTRSSAAKR